MQKLSCGCNAVPSNLNLYSSLYQDGRRYKYLQCNKCLSLFWNDIDEVINYNNSYYSFKKVSKNNTYSINKIRYLGNNAFAKLLRTLKPLSLMNTKLFEIITNQKYQILDYGSGSGNFGDFLLKIGYKGRIHSYDPYYRGDNSNILTDEFQLEWQNFDVIYSNQVFEHITNLQDILEELFNKVKTGTRLLFSMPLLGSIVKDFGELAYILQIPDHKSLFTLIGLKGMLNDSSWKTISIEVEDLHAEYGKLSVGNTGRGYRKDLFNDCNYTGGNNVVVVLVKDYV